MTIETTNLCPANETATLPILVTGGGRRLGLALVNALLKEGQTVITTYRTHTAVIEDLKAQGVHCIQVDFNEADDVTRLTDEVLAEYQGGLRAVIHNASDWVSEEDGGDPMALMTRMWQVHVAAPYQINLALAPLLEKAESALGEATDIIHLTDYVAEKGSDKHIAYASSKAGLANLTLSFASKLAPKVKVNAIAPSLLMFHPGDNEEYRQKALNKSILSIEPGEQEGVAAVQYVLSSRYMTGRTLSLDGGRHLARRG
ncbi:dihydromonapterin reductase [Rhodanobacter aciditrophus]|uniref:Dihydromonapterin reductase n=1 Tax=Rhodanobacter aciditrophus TaxID=1623218 RepID=A0ABW4B3X0_9GAMM